TTLAILWRARPVPMISIGGRMLAIAATMSRFPRSTFLVTCQDIPILMTTARGTKNRITVRCGTRTSLTPAGLLTATATGTTMARGAGRGSTIPRGALLRTTTAAGLSSVTAGAGARVLTMHGPFMVLRSWASLAARTGALDFPLAADGEAESAGSRWDRANAIGRGIAQATPISAT